MKYPIHEHVLSVFINIITLGFFYFVERATHKDMNEMIGEYPIVYTPYNEFRHLFLDTKWERRREFLGSFWEQGYWSDHKYDGSEIHARVYTINKECHLLSSYGLFMLKFLFSKYTTSTPVRKPI